MHTAFAKILFNPSSILTILIMFATIGAYLENLPVQKGDFLTLWAVPQVLKNEPILMYTKAGRKTLSEGILKKGKALDAPKILKSESTSVYVHYRGNIAITSTPFLYSSAAYLSSGDYTKDRNGFFFLSFLSFTISIFLLCRMAGFSWLPSTLLFSLTMAFFSPLQIDSLLGNIGQIHLLFVAMFLYFFSKKSPYSIAISGLILGLGVMLKPTIALIPIFALIVLLIDKKAVLFWRFVLGGMLGVILALIVSVSYFKGFSIWWGFIDSTVNYFLRFQITPSVPPGIVEEMNVVNLVRYGNLSPNNVFLHYFNINITLYLTLIMSFLFIYGYKKHSDSFGVHKDEDYFVRRAFLVVGLGSSIMLLGSSIVWLFYYLLLLPLLIFMIRPLRGGKRRLSHFTMTIVGYAGFYAFMKAPKFMSYFGGMVEVNLLTGILIMLISVNILVLLFDKPDVVKQPLPEGH